MIQVLVYTLCMKTRDLSKALLMSSYAGSVIGLGKKNMVNIDQFQTDCYYFNNDLLDVNNFTWDTLQLFMWLNVICLS